MRDARGGEYRARRPWRSAVRRVGGRPARVPSHARRGSAPCRSSRWRHGHLAVALGEVEVARREQRAGRVHGQQQGGAGPQVATRRCCRRSRAAGGAEPLGAASGDGVAASGRRTGCPALASACSRAWPPRRARGRAPRRSRPRGCGRAPRRPGSCSERATPSSISQCTRKGRSARSPSVPVPGIRSRSSRSRGRVLEDLELEHVARLSADHLDRAGERMCEMGGNVEHVLVGRVRA